MFKRSFQVPIQDYPHIFDNEGGTNSMGRKATENRQIYIDDDGTVHIIKTWYFPNNSHDHGP